jgi:hypothetical protein
MLVATSRPVAALTPRIRVLIVVALLMLAIGTGLVGRMETVSAEPRYHTICHDYDAATYAVLTGQENTGRGGTFCTVRWW